MGTELVCHLGSVKKKKPFLAECDEEETQWDGLVLCFVCAGCGGKQSRQ